MPLRLPQRALLRAAVALSCTLLLVTASACSGDGGTPVAPSSSGSLTIAVSGLPAGAQGDLLITGPSGYTRTITAGTQLTGLAVGGYSIVARTVRTAAGTYGAEQSEQTVVVVAGSNPTNVSVRYRPNPAIVRVDVEGLPNGASASATVRSPSGSEVPVGASLRLADAAPGAWTLSATPVRTSGFTWAPVTTTETQTLLAGDSVRFVVRYTVATGAVAVLVSGLPDGMSPTMSLTGPGGSRVVNGTMTLTDLEPGTYVLDAPVVDAGSRRFRPGTASQTLVVTANTVATPATVSYAPVAASLTVLVNGAPNAPGDPVRVTGPNGFTRAVGTTTRLTGLEPGVYIVTAGDISQPAAIWRSPVGVQQRTLLGDADDSVSVTYAVATGAIAFAVSGLPQDEAASISVSGPGGFSTLVTSTATLVRLAPGTYAVSVTPRVVDGVTYLPSPSTAQIAVSASLVATPATVQYTAQTARLLVRINGVPAGASPAVNLLGPDGFARSISTTTTLTNLFAGTYTISAAPFNANGISYASLPATAIRVLGSSGIDSITFNYVAQAANTGALALTVNGLPANRNAAITLTGAGGSRLVTGTTTIVGLTPGSYQLTAEPVVAGGAGTETTYNPNPASSSVNVTTGNTVSATITYTASASPTSDDFSLEYVYVTQATQRLDGSVPLVSGRPALIRAFVRNNRANSLRPDVRVRVYHGTSLIRTATLAANGTSIPTAINEGVITSSWNLDLDGSDVVPGLRVLVDVDPASSITDSDRSNNVWPRNGSAATIDVRTVAPFVVRFIPVTVAGLTGNVTVANVESYLSRTRLMHPINTVTADVRLPFVSSAPPLSANDENGAWTQVLSEINALRQADGAPASMHYYGVVKASYTSGVAGYGYVPGRAAIGWDWLPSGDGVAAHEFGHNFSRPHSPCGVLGDFNYPYGSGNVGVSGWNSGTGAVVQSSVADFMGYCNPTWVSDWTWTKVLEYRAANLMVASSRAVGSAASSVATDGLLVWGRIVNGRAIVEPAFRVTAPPTTLPVTSLHRLELLDEAGVAIAELPIPTEVPDHASGRDERQFAVVIPWSAALESRLSSIRVRDTRSPLTATVRGSETLRRGGRALPATVARRARSGATEALEWDTGAYPMAMLRDPASGRVLGFLRRSGDRFRTATGTGGAVDVVFSDGVRSRVERLK